VEVLMEIFSPINLLAIFFGTLVGIFIGALPGLGATIAVILLLPITFNMPPLAAILMLLAAFQGAEYGGSISAIVLGIPGTAAAAPTVLDGNALAKKVSPGKAFGYSLSASVIGGIAGGLLLFTAEPIAMFALRFSDPEFFLIGILGILTITSLGSKDNIKSMISAVLGLMAGTVGIDMFTGVQRFTWNRLELADGFSLIALLVGMYAFTEIFVMISEDLRKRYHFNAKGLRSAITFKEFRETFKFTGVGSIIGVILGIVPGVGASASSWLSYTAARKMSKKQEEFGKGNPEGIVAPEAANNATVGGSLLPLMSLGIPGSPAMAVIMGAFIIHGVRPGPNLFTNNTNLVYGIFYGFLSTTIAMYLVGKLVTPLFSRALLVKVPLLAPAVLLVSIVGVYADSKLTFELWVALIAGIVGLVMRLLDFSIPAFFLAFVLSPILEESLRRTLLISDGSYAIFLQRPFSVALLVLIVIVLAAPYAFKAIKLRRLRKQQTAT